MHIYAMQQLDRKKEANRMSFLEWISGKVVKKSLDNAEVAVTRRLVLLKKNIIKTAVFLFFLLMGITLLIKGLLQVLEKVLPIEYWFIIIGVISILVAIVTYQKSIE